MASKKSKFFLLLLVVLIVWQFFPTDQTNPPVEPTQDYLNVVAAPQAIAGMIKDACYDCHSHEVKYPWYTKVQPVGWWLKGHVKNGLKHLNFSIWSTYSPKKANHKLEECIEMMEAGSMPLKSYTWMHPEARFSDQQEKELIDWFKSQYKE